jgi:hypothetical protein
LFWTIAVPSRSVRVDLEEGTARYRLRNVRLRDYRNIFDALNDAPHQAGTTSFDLKWSGVVSRFPTTNVAEGFTGEFMKTGATMEWSATSADGFSFKSDPASTSTAPFAVIGRERNGRFLNEGDDQGENAGGNGGNNSNNNG